MKKIRPLRINNKTALRKIIEEQNSTNKASLETVKEYVKEDYEKYDTDKYSLENLIPDVRVTSVKDELIGCYKEGEYVDKLKQQIKDNIPNQLKGLCLYCLIPGTSTLDHYIPKSKYPEFSIYSDNLIPCCRDCNSYKSTTWKRGNDRIIFNPYFDDPINDEYLFIDIRLKRIPYIHRVRLNFTGCVASAKEKAMVEEHYEKQQKKKRYRDISISYLQELVGELKNNPRVDIEKSLKNKIRSFDGNKGPNYWQTAVCKGILRNNDVLKWLSV